MENVSLTKQMFHMNVGEYMCWGRLYYTDLPYKADLSILINYYFGIKTFSLPICTRYVM